MEVGSFVKEITKIPYIFPSFVHCRLLKKKKKVKEKFLPSRKENPTYCFCTSYIIKTKEMRVKTKKMKKVQETAGVSVCK